MPIGSGCQCYDNFVDITDETELVDSFSQMSFLKKVVFPSKLNGSRRRGYTFDEESYSFDHGKNIQVGKEDIFQIPVECSFEMTPQSAVFASDNTQESNSPQKKEVTFSDDQLIYDNDSCPSTSSLKRVSEDESDSDSDSDLESIHLEKFQTGLFNKFGGKLQAALGLINAKSVSHVYKGAVLVTDLLGSKVSLFERSGKIQRTFLTKDVSEPWAATMTPDGHVAVTLRRQRCVALWSNDGHSMEVFGEGELQCPAGIAVDKTGRIFVADEQLNDVLVFNQSGRLLFKLSDVNESQFKQPRYVCCSQSGRILVSDSGNHCVKVFDRNGQFISQFGSFGKGNGQFKFPYGVCVDQHDNIVVADHHNNRVVMFTANGEFIQNLVTSATGLRSPCGVAIRCTHNRKLFITHGELRASEVVVYKLTPVDCELSINVKHYV